MKIFKIMAMCAMLLMSFSVLATCPVQETTIFYLNGISNNQGSTATSTDELARKVLVDSRVRDGCIGFAPAFHTNDELYTTGFFEKGLQLSQELTGSVQSFWENVLRLKVPDGWFEDEVDALFVRINDAILAGTLVDDNQAAVSLAKFRTELNNRGRQILLVAHSDGNNYANRVWRWFTFSEKENAHIVAVATPTPAIADGGPYTILEEDKVLLPTGAPTANVSMNGEFCADIVFNVPVPWLCHGFTEAYMLGTEPQTKIVNDIIVSLPLAIIPGTVQGYTVISTCYGNFISPNETTQFYREDENGNWMLAGETVSDGNGFYQIALPSGTYYAGESEPIIVSSGTTVSANIIVGLVPC